jgi:hypothetical protein
MATMPEGAVAVSMIAAMIVAVAHEAAPEVGGVVKESHISVLCRSVSI